MGFKILGLKVADLRNLKLVDLEFDGKNFIEITGRNGAGKSSVIDALFIALTGTKYLGRGFPAWHVIRKEADKALVKVVFGNAERQIEVKRSITKKESGDAGGSLTIKDTTGMSLNQTFLDTLLNEFTVDPLTFANKPPKEQVGIIKELAGVDTSALDEQEKALREERTMINREAKRIKAIIDSLPREDAQIDFDITKLIEQRKAIDDKNRKIEQAKLTIEQNTNSLGDVRFRIAKLEEEIGKCRAIIEKTEAANSEMRVIAMMPIESTEAVDLAISTAGDNQRKHDQYQQRIKLEKDLDKLTNAAKEADTFIESVPSLKAKMIAESKLPFNNLTFDDDVGVMIGGIPFSQLSTAEKIKASARIGMAMSPEFRVICIRDGAALDQDSLEALDALAKKQDYQIIVETVGEKEGENQIVIRAGRVISEFERETKGEIDGEQL